MGLTERQRDALRALRDACDTLGHSVSPMMIGGRDGSHHSATLKQLVKKGLVERIKRSAPWGWRGSYVYRPATPPVDASAQGGDADD